MKYLHIVAFILLAVGGLNWLGVAFNYNVVEMIFGTGQITMIIYILVGLSAIYELAMHKQTCKMCGASHSSSMGGGM